MSTKTLREQIAAENGAVENTFIEPQKQVLSVEQLRTTELRKRRMKQQDRVGSRINYGQQRGAARKQMHSLIGEEERKRQSANRIIRRKAKRKNERQNRLAGRRRG